MLLLYFFSKMERHINELLQLNAGTSLFSAMSQCRACATCKKILRVKETVQAHFLLQQRVPKEGLEEAKGECRPAVP